MLRATSSLTPFTVTVAPCRVKPSAVVTWTLIRSPNCAYKGHIHTAQIELYEHETPNLRKVDVKAVKGCVSRDLFRTTRYPDETTVRSFHFNPNAIELRLFEQECYRLGDCESLSDFDLSLRYWAHNANVSADCAHIVRLDFALIIKVCNKRNM